MRLPLSFLCAVILMGSGCVIVDTKNTTTTLALPALPQSQKDEGGPKSKPTFSLPLDRADNRVTKKPFGIKIDPANSPVSPERFRGIHTGVDFEAFPEEAAAPVTIYAICEGKLLRKQPARGYGGMLVQACTLNKQPITVVYGHISLASVTARVGDTISQGERLAVLGNGFSSETDGERKHLHLGVHRGEAVDTRGYVATERELKNWVNIMEFLE